MPWGLLAHPIAAGTVAYAARRATVPRASARTGAIVSCRLVAPSRCRSSIARTSLAAVALSAVISLIPTFFPVHRRDRPRRLVWTASSACTADEYRNQRRHGIDDRHGRLRVDPPPPIWKWRERSMHRSARTLDTQRRWNDPNQDLQYVLCGGVRDDRLNLHGCFIRAL
jgi:hypothetical protein